MKKIIASVLVVFVALSMNSAFAERSVTRSRTTIHRSDASVSYGHHPSSVTANHYHDDSVKYKNTSVNANVNKNVNVNVNRHYYNDNGRYYYYDDHHHRVYDGWVAGYTAGIVTMAMINAHPHDYMTCYATVNGAVYQGWYQYGSPCYVSYPGSTNLISINHYSIQY